MKKSTKPIPLEFFTIDKNSKLTLQMQLITKMVSLILEKNMEAGTRFPSTRKLAEYLDISRLTVSLAYQELVSQGYLTSIKKSGYMVAEDAPKREVRQSDEKVSNADLNWDKKLNTNFSNRRKVLKPLNWTNYKYPFLYGQMDNKIFNYAAWRECARQAFGAKDFNDMAGDFAAADDEMLTDYICSRTLPRRGIDAKPSEVLITMGAQNALWITVQILSQNLKGKAVFEDPGYPDVVEMLRHTNMPMHASKIDEFGLNPDLIPENTALVSATPSHHVPTGVTMPMDRREALIKKAEEDDFIIIEDDYEFERSFLAPPSPTLKSMDKNGRVIYMGSFSKSIFPGLRLGYLVAPEAFIKEARGLRALMLRHPPGHLQRTTAYFLAQGYYDALIVKARHRFKQRREILEDALNHHEIEFAKGGSHGGSSLWVKGPDKLHSPDFAEKLKEKSVLIEAGDPFFETPDNPCPYFRIAFSSIEKSKIPDGVAIIADQIKKYQ